MRIICKVKEVLEPRSFRSSDEEVAVQGILVDNMGVDLYAEGFDKMATKMQKVGIAEGDIIQMDVTVSSRVKNSDKGVFYSTNARVDNFSILVKSDKAF